jgi:4-amino-4-deoxy-L-arabinose transferase-like glycosyltransferase
MDLPFAVFVVSALAAFEIGRRRGSPAVQWVASQALVGLGILTKGLAPLFFHPPAAFVAWRRRMRVPPRAVALGVAVMALVVATWVVAYARSGPLLSLRDRLSAEVALRTTGAPAGQALHHLASYPFVLLVAAAPWTLVLAALVSGQARAKVAGLARDPWSALALAAATWGIVVFAFVPGTLPRYLIPVLPFASVLAAGALERLDRPRGVDWPWLVLAVAWLVAAPAVGAGHFHLPAATVAATAAAGLLAVAGAREVSRRFGAFTAALLAAGLLYGVVYAGLVDSRAAVRHGAFVAAAEALAPRIRPHVPLVVAEGTDRRFTWPLVHRLGRLAVEEPPGPPYDLVGPVGMPLPANSRPVAESGGFALFRVRHVPRRTP